MMTEVERLRRSVQTLTDELDGKGDRLMFLEAYLVKWIRPAIEDLEKQHNKKGYYHGDRDVNDYMAGVADGFRALFPKEGTESAGD